MSSQSLKSDHSNEEDHSGEGESGEPMSDENTESPEPSDNEEQDYSKYMPWIKVCFVTSLGLHC